MKAPQRRLLVDALLLLQMLGLAGTGVVLKWVLPPGHGRGGFHGGWWQGEAAAWGRRTFLGLGRHDWGEVHFWLSLALVVLLVVHLALHRRWVARRLEALARPGRAKAGAGCEPPAAAEVPPEPAAEVPAQSFAASRRAGGFRSR